MDSATGACSVALWRDGAIVARRFAAMDRGQSEIMVPMVQEVMAEAGVGFQDLDGLGVTIGPGAFTGLRIGLAAARGLALASGLPLVGVTTFEAVGHGIPPEERLGRAVVVAVESRREDIFIQSFDNDMKLADQPRSIRPDAFAVPDCPTLIAGDAAVRLRMALEARGLQDAAGLRFAAGPGLPDAADVAALVAERGFASAADGPPRPFYLRPPDVTLPAAKPR
ncbi:tRNA (adenosine(37)-N6)-threonylcarbamoyltransferase complex dimerization subunit type 1 TsaB [Skermanella stibiiresistens]|nr:tRNA (adenosine(37)-N6)-threonylcarbamoyltransferase complex dimerization subunit type 1 TsaB [Skermanella stibiiresistens]